MHVFLIILGSIGLMVGSMSAGILSCWMLWSLFKRINHPEWGPPLVLVPMVLTLMGEVPAGEFMKMTWIFASLAVIPFYAEGLAWRAVKFGRRGVRLSPQPEVPTIDYLPATPTADRRYPAIAGCIGEGRRPNPGELKRVASRILSEVFDTQHTAGFAEKRAALQAARAALEGN